MCAAVDENVDCVLLDLKVVDEDSSTCGEWGKALMEIFAFLFGCLMVGRLEELSTQATERRFACLY